MITKQERQRLLGLIENCCAYSGQALLFDHLRLKDNGPECVALATYSYNLASQNAVEAGQALIAFIEEITEKSDEV